MKSQQILAVRQAAWFLLIGVVAIVAMTHQPAPVSSERPQQPRQEFVERDLLSQMFVANGCWSGEAPADMQGQIPGHVVFATPGGTPTLGGEEQVGMALEQVFNGVDHGIEIYGFCR